MLFIYGTPEKDKMMNEDSQCFNCMESIVECKCGETEGYSNDSAICPYCGHENDPGDSNGGLYDESMTEWECGSCGKGFKCGLYISYSWTTTRKL